MLYCKYVEFGRKQYKLFFIKFMLWINNNILVPFYSIVSNALAIYAHNLEHAIREAITSLSLIFKACKLVYMIKVIDYWFISEIAFLQLI